MFSIEIYFGTVSIEIYFGTESEPCSGYLNDIHAFNTRTLTWTGLSASIKGECPIARYMHGFAASYSKLYIHGGVNGLGIWSFSKKQIGILYFKVCVVGDLGDLYAVVISNEIS